MKVSVIGAGAIGSMLGGLIKRQSPDVDVVLIVRGEHGKVVHQRGTVTLDGHWGSVEVSVRSSFDVADVRNSDYILCTVKSHDTDEAIESAGSYVGDATVISIQNGINDEILLRRLPPKNVVMGMTATNMAIVEPGRVSLQLNGLTVVGPHADGTNEPAARRAAELLKRTTLPAVFHENTLGARYSKLAVNALGYASCLSQSNFITEAIGDRSWRRNVGFGILDECIETFERAGIKPEGLPKMPSPARLKRFLGLFDLPALGTVARLGAARLYNKKPIVFSLGQDLKRGKKTEVEFINGEVCRLAAAHAVDAPYNTLVVELVHELEARGAGSIFRREQVIQRFRDVSSAALAKV